MAQSPILSVVGLTQSFDSKVVLDELELDVQRGESVAVVGASGTGKSTLLSILGLLMMPQAGRYVLAGHDVYALSRGRRAQLRGTQLGFVFQQFHLIRRTTVAANVAVPLAYAAVPLRDRPRLVAAMLARVGLEHAASQPVQTLSGGEQQRVAIARAMVLEPAVLLCDEPTGNLDPANTELVMGLILGHAERGGTVIVITHDQHVAAGLDRRLVLAGGRLGGSA